MCQWRNGMLAAIFIFQQTYKIQKKNYIITSNYLKSPHYRSLLKACSSVDGARIAIPWSLLSAWPLFYYDGEHTDYEKLCKYMSTYSTNPKPNLTVYSESRHVDM